MALNWTTNMERMGRIPGIDADKVREHGPKLLPLLRKHHEMFLEMTGEDDENDEDIVDLISSDIEFEDEDAEPSLGETSHFFAPPQRTHPDVSAFHARLEEANQSREFASQSQARSKPSWARGGAGGGGGRGKNYRRKGNGGVKKRNASGGNSSRKSSGGSAYASGSGFGGGGGGGGASRPSGARKDGKIVKKAGGGIGLMPL
ncbi:hypothetical protein LMH87_005146 [Akanthomyces muscarius]|nr:hypothetical protein LMH87_005146 [Akanthomyces muscarius]KAJ4163415.1 hypothetical protein LMH87_005146 [Akanthomyces muscarius]